MVCSRPPVAPLCTWGNRGEEKFVCNGASTGHPLKGNLESKFATHSTKPLEFWGGQLGSEKHTKPQKTQKK